MAHPIPPESLGGATRRALWRSLHEAQETLRRTAHFLHDEYQYDQSRALYDLANHLGDIKARYNARTDVLELGRRRAESVAAAARVCIYTEDGSDPTPTRPACGAPATVKNPNHEEWYCRRHADPAWRRTRPGSLSHPFTPDQSDPRLCGDLHPDDGRLCGWDHEGLDP